MQINVMFKFSKTKDVVFVDIEANDKPKRILQFGAVKLKTDGILEYANWFSNPKCKITKHVLKMVKKNLDKIENGISHVKIIKKIYKFLNNTVLISYGPFDYSFLDSMSQSILKKKLNVEFIDLQNEWKKISMSKNVWALNKLALFFSINVEDEKLHDAFYDASTLYKIFVAWNNEDNKKIIKNLYKHIINTEKVVKLSQNTQNKKAKTINNLDLQKGFCFIKSDFKFSSLKTNQKLVCEIDVLEVTNHEIKRNWSFYYDIADKHFDIERYESILESTLKKLVISLRNKKVIIHESEYQKYIRLLNLCSKHINVFPINRILFTTGYSNLYPKINYELEQYMDNLELIKNWKVYEYLTNKSN